MPFFVSYVSSASRLLSTEQLDELLRTCRRNNAALGVTGALLYQDGDFIQVIEGEQDVVEALYARIQADERHRNVISLVRGHTEERQFGSWSMAFSDLSGGTSELAEQSRDFLQEDGGGSPGVGRRLLLSFRRSLDSRGR